VLPPHWPPSHTSTKHSNGSDDELEAIEGITVPTLSRKKTNARKWDIERLLKTQQAREKKKVVLITTEELHDAAEARSRQLIDAVRQECVSYVFCPISLVRIISRTNFPCARLHIRSFKVWLSFYYSCRFVTAPFISM